MYGALRKGGSHPTTKKQQALDAFLCAYSYSSQISTDHQLLPSSDTAEPEGKGRIDFGDQLSQRRPSGLILFPA